MFIPTFPAKVELPVDVIAPELIVPDTNALAASITFTSRFARVNPLVVFIVVPVPGDSWLLPVVANNFQVSPSLASLNKPEYLAPELVYLPQIPMSTELAPLPEARPISGSSTNILAVLTVTLFPETNRSPVTVKSPLTDISPSWFILAI